MIESFSEFSSVFLKKDAALLLEQVSELLLVGRFECILHPLGFFHIRLFASGSETFRLHYWPESRRELGTALTPFHDHVWNLTSCVLKGTLDNIEIEIEDDETGDFELALIEQGGPKDIVRPAGRRVSVRQTGRQTHNSGEYYFLGAGHFHYTIVPPNVNTVTIVHSEVVLAGGPRALIPLAHTGHAPTRATIIGSDEVVSRIVRILRS